jgi:hypothetical protein
VSEWPSSQVSRVVAGCPFRRPQASGAVFTAWTPRTVGVCRVRTGVRMAVRPDAQRFASALAARRAAVLPLPVRTAPGIVQPGVRPGPRCPLHARRVSIVVSALAASPPHAATMRSHTGRLDSQAVRLSVQHPARDRPRGRRLDKRRTVSPLIVVELLD